MVINRIIFLAFIVFCLSQLPLFGRDFQEPIEVIDPLISSNEDPGGLLTYGYCDISNIWYVIKNDWSSYYNRALGSFTLLNINNIFAFNIYYGTCLLVGPVLAHETPATVAPFWMNAVQFEYGLTGAINLFYFDFILEYARTSQHPIKSGYSQVTTDVLKAGLVTPSIIVDNFKAVIWLRSGYVDLFDFWQSPVHKPRTTWIFSPALHIEFHPLKNIFLYTTAYFDWLFLRSGDFDIDINAELGVSTANANPRISLFIQYYHSANSEIYYNLITPEDLLGLGFKFTLESN